MLATAVQPQTLRTTGRTAQVVPRHHLHRLRRRRSHGQRFKVLPFHFDRHFSPLTTDCCAAAGGGLQQPASTWGAVGSPVPATIRARPGQVNESGVIVVQNPKQKRVGGQSNTSPARAPKEQRARQDHNVASRRSSRSSNQSDDRRRPSLGDNRQKRTRAANPAADGDGSSRRTRSRSRSNSSSEQRV